MQKSLFIALLVSTLSLSGCSDVFDSYNTVSSKTHYELEPFDNCNENITIEFKNEQGGNGFYTSLYECDVDIFNIKYDGAFVHDDYSLNSLPWGVTFKVLYDFKTKELLAQVSLDDAALLGNNSEDIYRNIERFSKILLVDSRYALIKKFKEEKEEQNIKNELKATMTKQEVIL